MEVLYIWMRPMWETLFLIGEFECVLLCSLGCRGF